MNDEPCAPRSKTTTASCNGRNSNSIGVDSISRRNQEVFVTKNSSKRTWHSTQGVSVSELRVEYTFRGQDLYKAWRLLETRLAGRLYYLIEKRIREGKYDARVASRYQSMFPFTM